MRDSAVVAEVIPTEALGDAQVLGMRVSGFVEPAKIVEPRALHNERIVLPMPDRIAVPGRVWILGKLAPIQKDLPEAATFEKQRDHAGGLHDPVQRVIGSTGTEDLMRPFR